MSSSEFQGWWGSVVSLKLFLPPFTKAWLSHVSKTFALPTHISAGTQKKKRTNSTLSEFINHHLVFLNTTLFSTGFGDITLSLQNP
jgi:hypothetical protein